MPRASSLTVPLLLLFVSWIPASAQQIPFPIPERGIGERFPGEEGVVPQSLMPRQVEGRGTSRLLDRTIDRDLYELGPGDAVSISIMGYSDAFYQLEVSPEGMILLPKVGSIPLGGLTLNQAEGRVSARARAVYPDSDVDLTLFQTRVFKVYLVGDVPNPGPRAASPVTRVSELISEPEPAAEPRQMPAAEPRKMPAEQSRQIRNVVLVRASGDTLSVDLARFRQSGDIRFNPTVREGDTILVPGLDETVEVHGRVFFPGTYEYRDGESLADLLRVANGFRSFPSDAHETIRVTRFVDQKRREFFTFGRDEAMGSTGEGFELEPFDAIYVPGVSDYKQQKTAVVEGEVQNPGTYPIRPDTTTVRDLVGMAGGFTDEASLVSARLQRVPRGAKEEALIRLTEIPPELLTEDERRILSVRRAGNENNVVLDFQRLFLEGVDALDLPIKADDTLVVPVEREGVTVLGAVFDTGIVSYESGRSIEFYVDRAGGYTDRADEGDVVVLKAKLETRLEREDVETIDPGDTIIVPFEEERDWWEIYGTAMQIVTGITSLVLSFIAATR